eukprot:TRINITY_DN2404_c0_g1_i1.p2 TRINITY_DN2404_c0_g1~~TRINITY_DN2404_c0_g1_i1.p2  ORF type:complete len:350 (-),score=77.40 TRINITY_DN2404_c0_g1_i1:116-1117(-)
MDSEAPATQQPSAREPFLARLAHVLRRHHAPRADQAQQPGPTAPDSTTPPDQAQQPEPTAPDSPAPPEQAQTPQPTEADSTTPPEQPQQPEQPAPLSSTPPDEQQTAPELAPDAAEEQRQPAAARTVLVHDDANDIEALAHTLTSAFEDDPLIQYFQGPRAKSKRAYNRGMIWSRTVLHAELSRPKGHSTIHVSADRKCVAVWHHPAHWKISGVYLLKFMVALVRTFGWRALLLASSIREVEREHPKQPHMHLFIMGTHKEQQRQGYGSSVISEMLRYCDLERLPAYLESSNQLNLPFYRRHGFEMIQQIQGARAGCPPLYTMWREPQPIQKQ